MRLGERNVPLLIGGSLSLLFLLLTFIGPIIAPHDPMEVTNRLVIDGQAHYRPFPPFEYEQFPLGSDDTGRDLLSRILWGIRPTILLCSVVVLVRMLIGIPLGLIAGWFRGMAERLIDMLVSASVAVPSLVFSMALISFIGITRGLSVFIIALCLTGWADIAVLVKNRTLATANEPYIDSARSIGVSSGGILRHHVLPQLWPILPSLIAFELSAVLLLVAELGFLGLFIGGGFVYYTPRGDTPADYRKLTSGYPELGQLLSDIWAKIILTPWQIFFVSIVVLLAIFAFNMLGEGLRRRMDVTRSRPTQSWWQTLRRRFGAAG